MTDPKPLEVRARFHSKYLHALEPILDSLDGEDFLRPIGIFVEPCAEGGALIAGTNGKAFAVLRDPQGAATRPFRAIIPKRFRDRCAPPKPVAAFLEGDYELPLPAWAQPGTIAIVPICIVLCGQMPWPLADDIADSPVLASEMIETGNHWRAGDFRLIADVPDWRMGFKGREEPAQPRELFVDPQYVGQFNGIRTLTDGNGEFAFTPCDDRRGPIRVSHRALPDFAGLIMPTKGHDVAETPSWLFNEKPEAAQ